MSNERLTGYPSIDKPWLKYYESPETFVVPMCKNYDYIYSRAKRNGSRIALRYLNAAISYDKMFQKVDEATKALKQMRVKEGDIVSVCLPNIPEVVYIYYAINRVGAIANMLDLRCNASELLRSCEDAESELLIALDMVLDKFKEYSEKTFIKHIVSVNPLNSIGGIPAFASVLKSKNSKNIITWNTFIKNGKNYADTIDSKYCPNTAAVIAYTGGTTGVPKGVTVSNESLNAILEMNRYNQFPVEVGDRSLLIAPPWTYYGLNNCINGYLSMGQEIIMLPKVGADELGQLIMKYKPNHIITVPSALHAVVRDVPLEYDLSFLKSLIVGADKLDETFEEEFNSFLDKHHAPAVLAKGYGMTEVTAAAAYTLPNCNLTGSVGIPYVGNVISVFDTESTTPIEKKIGERGEIAITGPTVMQGYFGSAAFETNSILIRHADGKLWAHTGDIGHLNANGVLYIDGRIKRMFVKNGYKIFAGEVENQIMKNPIVLNCAVVSIPDSVKGCKEIAFCVLKENEKKAFAEEKIEEMLRNNLYDYEIPDQYIFIKELPLTGMNKTDYRALENLAWKENGNE